MKNPTQQPITEDDIAHFLVSTPDFFERHAELLAQVQLSSGHGDRAVSLQERQAELLRDKIKALELRVVEMIRHGKENAAITAKLQGWTVKLLQATQARHLPEAIVQGLTSEFLIPQAALKLWGLSEVFADEPFARGASSDAQSFAASLAVPYCGVNSGFEAASWLPEPVQARSLALIPLRAAADAPVLGLLVLASPDAQRFHSGMGTEFLESLGKLAGAALSRLQVHASA